jgi:hypothetical protein
MLKYKKEGKLLGVLKDDATEPEGDAFKFVDVVTPEPTNDTVVATEEEEKELEDATVE